MGRIKSNAEREASLRERFFARVQKDPSGCWLWVGLRNRGGYGILQFNRKQHTAHRLSWYLHAGSFPSSKLHLCHRCDVKRCVNPEHLFVGTPLDNARDCAIKGGYQRKLTREIVLEVVSLYRQGFSPAKIAHRLGLYKGTTKNVCYGFTWSWLTGIRRKEAA